MMSQNVFDSKNGKVIFVCINKSYGKLEKGEKVVGRETVYDCVRKYWPIKDVEKANEADFVCGVYNKLIVAVFKMDKHGWKKIDENDELMKEFENDDEVKEFPKLLSRYALPSKKGDEVKNSPYLGKIRPEECKFNQMVVVTYNY